MPGASRHQLSILTIFRLAYKMTRLLVNGSESPRDSVVRTYGTSVLTDVSRYMPLRTGCIKTDLAHGSSLNASDMFIVLEQATHLRAISDVLRNLKGLLKNRSLLGSENILHPSCSGIT